MDHRKGKFFRIRALRCRCAQALDRQDLIQNEIRKLKSAYPQARAVSLEDFLEDPANSQQFWDLIYSTSLLAEMPDVAARQIIKAAAYRLKPGGHLLLANPTIDQPANACTTCRGVGTNYRTEFELAGLTSQLSIDHFSDQVVFRGASRNIIYLELYRFPETGRMFCRKSAA
jgi:hypothetical protein